MTVQEKTTERVVGKGLSHARDISRPGYIVKLILMALVNALGVYGILAAWAQGSMGVVAFLVLALIVADWVYFSKRAIPLKYLYPGLLFLFVFQIYVMANTAYVAFTNYGDGHNSTKGDAIENILMTSDRRVEGSATYPVTVLSQGDQLAFAIVQDGDVKLGTADQPLAAVDGAEESDGKVTAVDGWDVLNISQIQQRQADVLGLRVWVSEDPADG